MCLARLRVLRLRPLPLPLLSHNYIQSCLARTTSRGRGCVVCVLDTSRGGRRPCLFGATTLALISCDESAAEALSGGAVGKRDLIRRAFAAYDVCESGTLSVE